MPCRSPIRQYHSKSGSGWSFNAAKPHDDYRDLNCGVCLECRIRKTREWSIRCYHEAQLHSDNSWVTLTYRDNPITLRRGDVTLFFKNLRNAGYRFRYFGAGEYGSETLRPHYHICLFGLRFADQYPWRVHKGITYYRSPALEKAWPHGNAEVGAFAPETARYVAGYTYKKINGRAADEADEETGLRPYDRLLPSGEIFEVAKEMLFVSLKPGIAAEWIAQNWRDVYRHDKVVMNGKEYLPPVYYDKQLKLYKPEVYEKIKNARLEAAINAPELSDERREVICNAREIATKQFRKRDAI